jgi:hypothetical protein
MKPVQRVSKWGQAGGEKNQKKIKKIFFTFVKIFKKSGKY